MTKRQISIRVGLDGGADVRRETEAIGKSGEAAGRKIVAGFDAATAAVGKYDAAGRRTAAAPKKDLPGGTYGAAYKGFDDEKSASNMLERQKEFQSRLLGVVRAGSAPVNLGAAVQAKSARDTASVFAATEKANAARVAQIVQWQREQTGQSFQSDFERRMGIGMRSAASSGATVSALEDQAREMEAMQARAQALLSEIDPLAAAEVRLTKETAEYNRMLSAGALTQTQHSNAMAKARLAYEQVAEAEKNAAGGARLSPFQRTNLMYQMNDVVGGLAMGQKPIQVMLQQGPQLAQVFAGSGLSVTGALKATASSLTGLVSPSLLVAAGISTVAASVAYLQYAGIKAGKELEMALTGTGRAAGVTAGQLNDMAGRAASRSGAGTNESRGWAETYAKSGAVPGSSIERLTALTADYAATTGQKGADAAKELATSFSDLGTGVGTLSSKIGGIDYVTQQYIVSLERSGEHEKAVDAAIKAMEPSLENHRTQLTMLGRAWEDVSTAAGRYVNGFTQAPSDDARLANLKDQLSGAQKDNKGGFRNETIATLKGLIAEIESRQRAAGTDAQSIADVKLSNQIAPLVGDLSPDAQKTLFNKQADAQLALLEKAKLSTSIRQKMGLSLGNVDGAIAAKQNQKDTYQSDTAKIVQGYQLQAQAAEAITPYEKAHIARQQVLLGLAGQTVSKTDAEARANAAFAAALKSANYELSRQAQLTRAATGQTRAVTGAYMTGGIAGGMSADAHRQAVLDNLQSGVSVEGRFRDLLGQSLASQGETVSQSVARLQAEADARKKDLDQVVSGASAYTDANRAMQMNIALADEDAATTIARKMGYYDLASELERVSFAYRKVFVANDDQARAWAGRKDVSDQYTQISQLNAQMSAAQSGGRPMDPGEQVRLQILGDTNALLEKGYAIQTDVGVVLTAQGKEYLANAQHIDQMNRLLERTKAANEQVYAFEGGIFDKLGDQITSSRDTWNQYFDSVITGFQRMTAELTIVNPAKNLLLGGDSAGRQLPTLFDVGGALGDLMGNNDMSSGDSINDIAVTGRKGRLTDMAAMGLSTGLGNLFSGDSVSNISVMGRHALLSDMAASGATTTAVGGGGWMSEFGTYLAGMFHTGGDVYGAPNSNRILPASVLRFAPRFHDGVDLKADEIPAILQTGERVLNRAEASDYRKGAAASTAPTINFHNYGEPVSQGQTDYDPKTNTLDIAIERQVTSGINSGIRNGSFDTSLGESFGVSRVLTRR